MIKIIMIIALAALIILLGLLAFFATRGPSLAELQKFDYLKEPKINTMPAQKMISVEIKGDPNTSSAVAFKELYATYYKLKRNTKGLTMVAPRARWSGPFDAPKKDWVGIYGIPIPDSVEKLPDNPGNVKLDIWQYGEVAEILYVGPYSEEKATIEKLIGFIHSNGYEIAGAHEEEYLKGPGMFFKGNPKDYYTVIRYPVKKKQ